MQCLSALAQDSRAKMEQQIKLRQQEVRETVRVAALKTERQDFRLLAPSMSLSRLFPLKTTFLMLTPHQLRLVQDIVKRLLGLHFACQQL